MYVLRTTTARHKVSFIDFYFHFLANFQTWTSPHMFSISTNVMSRVTHSEPGLPIGNVRGNRLKVTRHSAQFRVLFVLHWIELNNYDRCLTVNWVRQIGKTTKIYEREMRESARVREYSHFQPQEIWERNLHVQASAIFFSVRRGQASYRTLTGENTAEKCRNDVVKCRQLWGNCRAFCTRRPEMDRPLRATHCRVSTTQPEEQGERRTT